MKVIQPSVDWPSTEFVSSALSSGNMATRRALRTTEAR
ncbi:hypothetical protein RKD26_000193 [Streptomyces calvus]